jgi:DNA-binding NarL/FixJ family response regulator
MPRLLRSILARTVAAQTDMEVMEFLSEADLDAAVAEKRADVLIVEDRNGRSEARYRPLLLACPSLKVFLLTEDGRNATLLEFTRARIVDASPAAIVEAIRTVLRRDSTLGER